MKERREGRVRLHALKRSCAPASLREAPYTIPPTALAWHTPWKPPAPARASIVMNSESTDMAPSPLDEVLREMEAHEQRPGSPPKEHPPRRALGRWREEHGFYTFLTGASLRMPPEKTAAPTVARRGPHAAPSASTHLEGDVPGQLAVAGAGVTVQTSREPVVSTRGTLLKQHSFSFEVGPEAATLAADSRGSPEADHHPLLRGESDLESTLSIVAVARRSSAADSTPATVTSAPDASGSPPARSRPTRSSPARPEREAAMSLNHNAPFMRGSTPMSARNSDVWDRAMQFRYTQRNRGAESLLPTQPSVEVPPYVMPSCTPQKVLRSNHMMYSTTISPRTPMAPSLGSESVLPVSRPTSSPCRRRLHRAAFSPSLSLVATGHSTLDLSRQSTVTIQPLPVPSGDTAPAMYHRSPGKVRTDRPSPTKAETAPKRPQAVGPPPLELHGGRFWASGAALAGVEDAAGRVMVHAPTITFSTLH